MVATYGLTRIQIFFLFGAQNWWVRVVYMYALDLQFPKYEMTGSNTLLVVFKNHINC